jgi:hypothetical protein
VFGSRGCDENIDILCEEMTFSTLADGDKTGKRCTYLWDASDVGPECGSPTANEADTLHFKAVFDYVNGTTGDLAYFICSRWAR